MSYLIKIENIFGQDCKNVYIIEYQKCGLSYIYLLIFLNSVDKFLEAFYIDKVICAKLPTIDVNVTGKLTKIVTSIILYGLYEKINHYLPYRSNAQDGFSR